VSEASGPELRHDEAKVLPAREALSLISPDPPSRLAGDESAGQEALSLDSLSEHPAHSD
jgi:hypothetical protein